MPVHDGSRSDQDERLPPPGPERSQRNPKQLLQGSHSPAGSLRVQSQQLLTESQVFKDEVLAGAENAHHPAEEISERSDHGWNHIGKVRIEVCAKSFILWVYEVLARHSRTHVSLEKDAPVSRPVEPPSLGPVIEIPKVGSLHHLYTRKAA